MLPILFQCVVMGTGIQTPHSYVCLQVNRVYELTSQLNPIMYAWGQYYAQTMPTRPPSPPLPSAPPSLDACKVRCVHTRMAVCVLLVACVGATLVSAALWGGQPDGSLRSGHSSHTTIYLLPLQNISPTPVPFCWLILGVTILAKPILPVLCGYRTSNSPCPPQTTNGGCRCKANWISPINGSPRSYCDTFPGRFQLGCVTCTVGVNEWGQLNLVHMHV